ncbi:MAG: diguanylate cyclase [Planctomycetota bacterium]|nr:diguanylate cyclase [Planctomycetota bacterium]
MSKASDSAGPGNWHPSSSSILRTSGALFVAIALSDAIAPPEIPISVLYVMPILITVWLKSRRTLHLAASVASVLTIALAIFGESGDLGGFLTTVAASVTLFAIWTTWHMGRSWLTLGEDLEMSQAVRTQTILNLAEGVVTVDSDERVLMINPAAEEMTGWRADEAVGRPVKEVVRREKDVMLVPEDIVAPGMGEVLVSRAGETRPVEVTEAELPGGYVLVLRDAAEQRDREGAMLRLAYRDRLTGLPNRASLLDRLDLELAHTRRHGTQLGMLFLDLDGLKQVNDELGHGAGDALLVGFAERLRSVLREGDTVARLGGDEFTVLLPGLEDASSANLVAEKILAALLRPILHEGTGLQASASIGLALFPADASDGEQLLERADAAMYHAKETGGCRWERWTEEPVKELTPFAPAPPSAGTRTLEHEDGPSEPTRS